LSYSLNRIKDFANKKVPIDPIGNLLRVSPNCYPRNNGINNISVDGFRPSVLKSKGCINKSK